MKSYMKVISLFLTMMATTYLAGCAPAFKPADIDPKTGMFRTTVDVDEEYIKIFKPLAGLEEANFVYLRAFGPYGGDNFYFFMKDGLQKIGFENIYNEGELAKMVIQGGLSDYVTSVSDIIALNNLAKAIGPYLILESFVYPVSDVVFRFDLQLVDPLTGETYLEISRVRTNWIDMDTEINVPILNVIKKWHDASIELPYEKQADDSAGQQAI